MNQIQLRLALATVLLATSYAASQDSVEFNRDVLPILSDRCFRCHGPDAASRKADLRLDEEASAKASVIVPGNTSMSEFIQRITSSDPDLKMPPSDSKLELSSAEIETLRRWVEQGAKWQKHWSFLAPREHALPAVSNKTWCRNSIDYFILHAIEQAGLKTADEASRTRLIRRLSFDLTGLPPSNKDVAAFVADKNPDAYEALVDRLLASPAFGERLASEWLDAARYSDTYGYQVDRDRFVWPWRDWVVRAFNNNLPLDRFITQQIAGDLLPNATDDQILATTFNRLHPQKVEGGSVPEEFRVEYVADRTQTFGTAFLGLTLECCRCHDHKYDPLTQKEYYQLTAFFDNIPEAGLYSYFTPSVPTPTLLMTDDAMKEKLSRLRQQVQTSEASLSDISLQQKRDFENWLKSNPAPKTLIPGQIAHLDFESKPGGKNKSVAGVKGKAIQLSGDDGVGLKVGNFRRYEPFTVAFWMNTPDVKQRAVVFHRSRAWTDAGSRGYQLLIEDGKLSASLIHFWPGNAIRIRTKKPISTKQWHHVAITWDGSSNAAGLHLFLDGNMAACDTVRDNLYKHITGGGGDNIQIGERFRDRGFTDGLVDDFQVFNRQLTRIEVQHLFDGKSLAEALKDPRDRNQVGATRKELLFEYYLSTVSQQFRTAMRNVQQARKQFCSTMDGLQEIMVMKEDKVPRQTYLLTRGAYDARSEKVSATTPRVLPAFKNSWGQNRLGLAKWMTDRRHPLTARVAVNRYWQLIFGQGLVRTPEDFGRQGQPATHPELLDWLAIDFADHGWNIKRLIKLIVMSSTYRQSSVPKPGSVSKDSQNRLLSWSPTFRLPAEMLRDNALAVSGLLVRKQGGPPAKPYEVEVSFKPARRDKGDGLYRRSLYTYWKRTGPAPVMMTLDASKRDVCRVRRERTTTPTEAFVLMNGTQFVEAARVLAESVLKSVGTKPNLALADLFKRQTGRTATPKELSILETLYRQQLKRFENEPANAMAYLNTGDRAPDKTLDPMQLAALATVANALFSFDEVVNRR